jgi:hypothetical protein
LYKVRTSQRELKTCGNTYVRLLFALQQALRALRERLLKALRTYNSRSKGLLTLYRALQSQVAFPHTLTLLSKAFKTILAESDLFQLVKLRS